MGLYLVTLLLLSLLQSSSGFTSSSLAIRNKRLKGFLQTCWRIDDYGDNNNLDSHKYRVSRRRVLKTVVTGLVVTPCGVLSTPNTVFASTSIGSEIKDGSSTTSRDLPKVTHSVKMNIRISRSDGTFYYRGEDDDDPVFSGPLTLDLFGTVAPNHVKQFLKYVDVQYNPLDDDPLPGYNRSLFTSLNQATGLLMGGKIPGLELTTMFGGSTAFKYGERVLVPELWVEDSSESSSIKLSHNLGKGLLTHRNLDLSPEFGITTRKSSAADLDDSYTVFGRVRPDDFFFEFLDRVDRLPTYSVDRPAPTNVDVDDTVGQEVASIASKVYSSQRDFFRKSAKALGDTRIDKLYPGKLLRKVDVNQVEILS